MHTLRTIGATVGALILVGLASPAQAADTSLADQINSLSVTAEDRTGYDRDLFGDYDRQAELAENLAAWPDCDGYYSLADNECYTDASEVDVDHIVALAEAWDSGASQWSDAQRDEYAGYAANLWLMTDNLNQSKGDDDAAEWLPPYEPAVCDYVAAYVQVKIAWKLAVDQAEKATLLDTANKCEPVTQPTTEPTTEPTAGPEPSDAPSIPATTPASGGGGSLPVTGAPAALIAGVGVLLLGTGGALVMLRRRRVRFEA